MFTVNLEKQLIKQNKKVLLPSELLAIKEYERLGEDFCENDILKRLGINSSAISGRYFKSKKSEVERILSKYDKSRVFHITQIESLCEKYYLRFLSARHFKGTVDSGLASKVSTFEVANGVTCTESNCKIVAPASSFNLEVRPKDPLFFYNLGNDYWYLIHKWGNDLSIFRRGYSLLCNAYISYFLLFILPISTLLLLGFKFHNPVCGITGVVYFMIALAISIGNWINADVIRLIKKNYWESYYK